MQMWTSQEDTHPTQTHTDGDANGPWQTALLPMCIILLMSFFVFVRQRDTRELCRHSVQVCVGV